MSYLNLMLYDYKFTKMLSIPYQITCIKELAF